MKNHGKHFIFVLGTRPEIIKMSPLILAAQKRGIQVSTIFTGQHTTLALPMFQHFDIIPSFNLKVMTEGQTLVGLSARLLTALNQLEIQKTNSVVLVQGDTTSALIGAYWAFCQHIPVAHIEAGLRTFDLTSPFPEEGNRQLISKIANVHFTPTRYASKTLKKEGVPSRQIVEVGNTSIDALFYTLKKNKKGMNSLLPPRVSEFLDRPGKLILLTAHRRETFGEPFREICHAILEIVNKYPNVRVLYPVHPNPSVQKPAYEILSASDRVLLTEPLDYSHFVHVLNAADLILTDSGGVQEEAPSLKKPILVLRNETERPEGVRMGFARLIGTDRKKLVKAVGLALTSPFKGRGPNPYGDGKTSLRIIRTLEDKIR